jgi:hypothetical protein
VYIEHPEVSIAVHGISFVSVVNHKLIRWHFVIVGGIDGYSRLVAFFLQCKDNNKSAAVLECFLSGVSKFGLPHRVTSDKGLENTAVADFIISARGPLRACLHYHLSIY